MIDAYILNLPLTPYDEVLKLQRAAVSARYSGRLAADLIILVEHPPVFTMGRRGGLQNLTVDPVVLEKKGISVQSVERGGDITYHGPGQLIAYPIVNLNEFRKKVVAYVTALETVMIETALHWGVQADGDPRNRGAWIGRRKLGSIGITVRRGITFHGLALNVNTDLTPFQWINPCGIEDCKMTSLSEEIGRTVSMASVRFQMQIQLTRILGLNATDVDSGFVYRHI